MQVAALIRGVLENLALIYPTAIQLLEAVPKGQKLMMLWNSKGNPLANRCLYDSNECTSKSHLETRYSYLAMSIERCLMNLLYLTAYVSFLQMDVQVPILHSPRH